MVPQRSSRQPPSVSVASAPQFSKNAKRNIMHFKPLFDECNEARQKRPPDTLEEEGELRQFDLEWFNDNVLDLKVPFHTSPEEHLHETVRLLFVKYCMSFPRARKELTVNFFKTPQTVMIVLGLTAENLMQTKQGLQKSARRDLGILMALTILPGANIQKIGSTTFEIPRKRRGRSRAKYPQTLPLFQPTTRTTLQMQLLRVANPFSRKKSHSGTSALSRWTAK